VRGGQREVAFVGADGFVLGCEMNVEGRSLDYQIEIKLNENQAPKVCTEQLIAANTLVFRSHAPTEAPMVQFNQLTIPTLPGILAAGIDNSKPALRALQQSEMASRLALSAPLSKQQNKTDLGRDQAKNAMEDIHRVLVVLAPMRFLDLSPDRLRKPSTPGQTVLGQHGDNLSSVLQAICEDEGRKATLTEWIRALSPLDISDLEFPVDYSGQTLVHLVEKGGRKLSANSASDGTLRFLGIAAALLGRDSGGFLFIEELENGIHPTRLHLLIELIEHQCAKRTIQVVATTHSPTVLSLLTAEDRGNALLVYRRDEEQESHVRRIVDIPDARRVLENRNLGRLHQSGWMEDIMSVTDAEESTAFAQNR